MWAQLEPVGLHHETGGYRRYAWTDADMSCREWFATNAENRGLSLETDGNGNLWAWWGNAGAGDAIVIGSHLDSVPDGGAFDGPLGVVSAFAATDALRGRGIVPLRPVAIAAFSDEEGARFGMSCVGSRLLTGQLTRERGLSLQDAAGINLERAMRTVGHDVDRVGPDPERLQRIGAFVELHVEQGHAMIQGPQRSRARGLVEYGSPIGLATSIHPHGRWRFDLAGRADHAGTTALVDRDDPMLRLASLVTAARKHAYSAGAVATVGRVIVEPNGVNAIPSLVRVWLDVRGPEEGLVRGVVAQVEAAVGVEAVTESWTPEVEFDPDLRKRLARALKPTYGTVPELSTAAGHDAGILASSGVPSAMLFVRNPSGTSHSPVEYVEPADRYSGVHALTQIVQELVAS